MLHNPCSKTQDCLWYVVSNLDSDGWHDQNSFSEQTQHTVRMNEQTHIDQIDTDVHTCSVKYFQCSEIFILQVPDGGGGGAGRVAPPDLQHLRGGRRPVPVSSWGHRQCEAHQVKYFL